MKDEAGTFAAIVAEVKQGFAGRNHTGDEVTREIGKRWAKASGRKWQEPSPPEAGGQEGPSVAGKQSRINVPKDDEEGADSLKGA